VPAVGEGREFLHDHRHDLLRQVGRLLDRHRVPLEAGLNHGLVQGDNPLPGGRLAADGSVEQAAVDNSDLCLRAGNGELRDSEDGQHFSQDMSADPGVQRFTMSPDTVVTADIGGSVHSGDMSGAAGTFRTGGAPQIDSGVTVSTRQINGQKFDSAPSIAESRDLAVEARRITVGADARLFAQAGDGFRPGNAVFTTHATIDMAYISGAPFRLNSTTATVEIGERAVIRAGNFAATAQATTAKTVRIETALAEMTTPPGGRRFRRRRRQRRHHGQPGTGG
jgi:hypothetical protein